MESDTASFLLIILGTISALIGFFIGDWFWGSLLYVGISWIAAGVIYGLAGREVSEGGLLAAFVFGFIGAIGWVVVDMSRSQNVQYSWKERGRVNRENEGSYRPILSELDDPDSEYMVRKLVSEYRDQGFLNPELLLQSKLNKKTSSGKTKKDAIRELYEEEIKKTP